MLWWQRTISEASPLLRHVGSSIPLHRKPTMQLINGHKMPTVTATGIYGFFGEYRCFSNFHICNIDIGDGIIYRSSEAAFMAQKTDNLDDRRHLASLTPPAAKKYGQTVTLRPDWDYYRVVAMTKALTAKFTQHPDLATELLQTSGLYLEETNDWGDRFWGVDGTGLNMLGHCLMLVRDDILPGLSLFQAELA